MSSLRTLRGDTAGYIVGSGRAVVFAIAILIRVISGGE